ncbi:DUF488 domain-containing protein [Psychrobacter sp. 1U2]|uniref:DUF488 domain-containing protein n=1 Tax=Psychrobacter sp. 1U2 TaxID=3453577 RepID=UPI003F45B19B
MTTTFYTIGHSTRSLDELIDMLQAADIELLVDVRSFPRSSTNPHFNIDTLPQALSQVGISYQHCIDLGGRRPKQKQVDEDINNLWRVQAFHNYADYALSDTFQAALDKLIQLGKKQRLTLMCSEAVWWRCHRRIITDYLLLRGHRVEHIMGVGRLDPAKPTLGAELNSQGYVVYPAI